VTADIEPMIVHQRIRLPYRYTAGTAHKVFLRGLAEQRIIGCRCDSCGITLAPARPFCPRCSGATGEPVELGDTGILEGWTTVNRAGRPVCYGLVRVDGADTALVHRVEASEEALAVGLRLRARWAGARSGEITDIEAFEPAGSQ